MRINKLNQLPEVADQIIGMGKDYHVWLLQGDMGAGKTTLTKAIGEKLKVLDTISSPTYALVNEYLTKDDKTIYHFDFYRLEQEVEALDMGWYEYLDSGNLCIIEWPQKISNLLPETFLNISISQGEGEERIFKISAHE